MSHFIFFISACKIFIFNEQKIFARSTRVPRLARTDCTCAMHSRSITHSTCDTKCHIISLLLPPAKTCSNKQNKKNSCTTFILTPQSKSKSKHSTLFKKRKRSKSKQTRTNTKQKLHNVEPIQAVLWVIEGPKCVPGRRHIYGHQNRSFSNKLDEPFAKLPNIKSVI